MSRKRITEAPPTTVLVVPGFLADVYSEIEASYVELSARATKVKFVWLTPPIRSTATRFADGTQRMALDEPKYVKRLRDLRVPYVTVEIRKLGVLHNISMFRKLFREHRIDAVYTHFGFERFWAAFCAKLFGRRVIWNEHWHSLGTRFALAKRIFYRMFVDDFIAVSSFIANTLPAKPGRIHHIPNSIASRISDPTGSKLPPLLQKPGTKTVVLMVAAFRPEKRHMVALDICERVHERCPHTTFIFLGEGVLRPSFIEEVQRRGMQAYVSAPGHVADVDAYYRIADVCMLTSYQEPFGYCILEAMMHGRPMVAFEGGGPSEILRPDVTGLLVPEGDAAAFANKLTGVLWDEHRRHEIGEAARRSVRETYSRDEWIRTLDDTLDRVLRRRGNVGGTVPAGCRET